eukprot:gene26775-51679_t
MGLAQGGLPTHIDGGGADGDADADAYRRGSTDGASVLPNADWLDSTVVTTGARSLVRVWLPHFVAEEYALCADWDDNWGGRRAHSRAGRGF